MLRIINLHPILIIHKDIRDILLINSQELHQELRRRRVLRQHRGATKKLLPRLLLLRVSLTLTEWIVWNV